VNCCKLIRLFRNFIILNPQASRNIKSLIISTLSANSFCYLNKSRKKFIKNVFVSFLSIKGRINFLQLERFGEYSESTYRSQFQQRFDFFEFNKNLVNQFTEEVIIGFDPSYLSKSGKKTHGVGYFWSGVAGKSKWGLEVAGFAAIDPVLNTAFHLDAYQTPAKEELELLAMTLLVYYASLITKNATEFKKLSQYIVADAYFSKLPFLEAVSKAKLFFISRLRSDSDLKYLYNGPLTGKRGAPKKFDGKIDFKNLSMDHFKLDYQDQEMKVYGSLVHSVAFEKKIKIAVVHYLNLKGDKIKATKIYFSSNLKQESLEILTYYKARFQIEFLFRDGKQFVGVNTCEARSENKINFHVNTALTVVNLAKIDWFSNQNNHKKPFSIADYKTHFNNELMVNRIISLFGINPNKHKNKIIIRKLLNYGKIAA
jgi:hypothetical protein